MKYNEIIVFYIELYHIRISATFSLSPNPRSSNSMKSSVMDILNVIPFDSCNQLFQIEREKETLH